MLFQRNNSEFRGENKQKPLIAKTFRHGILFLIISFQVFPIFVRFWRHYGHWQHFYFEIFLTCLNSDYFITKKTNAFSSECNSLRLAQRLEFNQPFLSLRYFKIFSKGVIWKFSFLVRVCCNDFVMENIPAHSDPFQFIEILQFMQLYCWGRGFERDGKGGLRFAS